MLNNVKSILILKKIFGKVKNKRKLNIIKYNKRIRIKLDIDKEDFEIYITLKKFNSKYYTYIEDTDIKVLNLHNRLKGNEDLKDFVKINFNKLEVLDLSGNEISDINILENVNFKKLKELDLSENKISDIKVLEKVKFEKLEELDLRRNEIDLTKNNLIISKLRPLLEEFVI